MITGIASPCIPHVVATFSRSATPPTSTRPAPAPPGATFRKPDLDLSPKRDDHDAIPGDAYEYLMRHCATESRTSKGQFYTPADVSHTRFRPTIVQVITERASDFVSSDPPR